MTPHPIPGVPSWVNSVIARISANTVRERTKHERAIMHLVAALEQATQASVLQKEELEQYRRDNHG